MSLLRPWVLLLLPLVLLLWVGAKVLRRRTTAGLGFAMPPGFTPPASLRARLGPLLSLLRLVALLLLVIALAGPRLGRTKVRSFSEGIDIVIALDISGSMRALDFAPGNRLDAAKKVARAFIERRTSDRIGLVVFASNSYTQCPLTTDYQVLLSLLDQVQIGDIEDGTAIGMAIGNALNRLKNAPGRSKVIILLTDGMNNTGVMDPLTAAGLARKMGVKVYTVGAGRKGLVPFPVDDPIFGRTTRMVEVDLDEETLQAIADSTGGLYFRATDTSSLEKVFHRIDQMEKTRVQVEEFVEYNDIGVRFVWPALALAALEVLLGLTVLRRLP